MRPCVGQTKTSDGARSQRNRLGVDVFTEESESGILFSPNVRVENTCGKQRASLEDCKQTASSHDINHSP